MLWIDSHRPKNFEETEKLKPNALESQILKSIAKLPNSPHVLIYGPDGCGKSTIAYCYLKEIYGDGVFKMKSEMQEFKTPSNVTKELNVISSSYHIDICPSDLRNYDRLVVQELIKSQAQSCALNAGDTNGFKSIIIRHANRLSSDAQNALRRTMEKYVSTCKLILITDNLSGVKAPLKSRCLCVRSTSPEKNLMHEYLKDLVYKETKNKVNDDILKKVLIYSKGDMRRALLTLQAIEFQDNAIPPKDLYQTDWEVLVSRVAKAIFYQQSTKTLLEIREMFYQLLARCISATTIINELCAELSKILDQALKADLYTQAAMFSHRMHHGDKEIIHLEAFAAYVMSKIKYSSEDLSSMDLEIM